jgi:hypothetical protein
MVGILAAKAQYLDTLHEVFTHKSNIDARLESRYSFINNQVVSVTGVRLGVAFQRKLRIGGGISWLKSDYKATFHPIRFLTGKPDTITRHLKFGYLCFYLDFVFYKTKRWQLSVPIQAGFGTLWFQKNQRYNFWGGDHKYFLALYEPGITAQFKVTKWFGLGTDVAYRFSIKNNRKIRHDFDAPGSHFKVLAWSPTYSFKILIWFDQLYYELFPKSTITKRFGPAAW